MSGEEQSPGLRLVKGEKSASDAAMAEAATAGAEATAGAAADEPATPTVRPGEVLAPLADMPAAGVAWWLPAGSTGKLHISGDVDSAPELMWSSRCGHVPSTRVVAFLDGPGSGDVTTDFQQTHRLAEHLAKAAQARDGVEAGPIEVFVFRPDSGASGGPSYLPVVTRTGVEFAFEHAGGGQIRVVVTLPAADDEEVE